MASSPIKHYSKIYTFLYVLFVLAFFSWFYFNKQYANCSLGDLHNGTNSSCFIYKDIASFCFVGWIVALIVLVIFTANNLMNKGIKSLKKPAIAVLATAVLFLVVKFCFTMFF